jgi:dolichol kinase
MIAELKRKAFHALGLGYVAGVLLLPRPVFLAAVAGLLILDIAMEIARLNWPGFAEFLNRRVGGLFRSEESRRLTGVFWMLLGVLSSALLIESSRIVSVIYLFVIFGDGIASLAGKGLGGPHWPGSPKRISGSAACFAMCAMMGGIFLRPDYSWLGILAGAFTATALEYGVIPINDNFLIPLGSSIVLKWIYQLGWGI